MVRYALTPVLELSAPLLIFTLPVVVSALYGGFGPALLATITGGLIGTYLFIGGVGFAAVHTVDHFRIALFLIIGLTVSVLGKRMKESQANALHANEQLRLKAEQLQASTKQLQEAHKQKDEFLAMLGHELRNPLAAISAANELQKFVKLDETHLAQTNEVISRQIQHMVRLVDDLLDVSRVNRGLIVIERKPVDLNDCVHTAIEQVRTLIDEKEHRLLLQLPTAPVWVQGDQTRLVQVISNLLSNAAKYTPQGGELLVQIAKGTDYVELVVQDNGVGMEPELLHQVFDLFTQAKRTLDRSQGGLGLGLPLVKSLIALHGGTIKAESAGQGKGCRFIIQLPALHLAQESNSPAKSEPVAVPYAAASRILVVDDNQDAANNLGLLLEAQGHHVMVGYNAKHALDCAHSEELDVIILDIGMPEMDGYELAGRLRLIPSLSEAIFIALTGYGQAADKEKAISAGFDHHFTKPVNIARLTALLAETGSTFRS